MRTPYVLLYFENILWPCVRKTHDFKKSCPLVRNSPFQRREYWRFFSLLRRAELHGLLSIDPLVFPKHVLWSVVEASHDFKNESNLTICEKTPWNTTKGLYFSFWAPFEGLDEFPENTICLLFILRQDFLGEISGWDSWLSMSWTSALSCENFRWSALSFHMLMPIRKPLDFYKISYWPFKKRSLNIQQETLDEDLLGGTSLVFPPKTKKYSRGLLGIYPLSLIYDSIFFLQRSLDPLDEYAWDFHEENFWTSVKKARFFYGKTLWS